MSTTIKERLLKEINDLPPEVQEKILKIVHSLKKEILTVGKKGLTEKKDIMSLLPRKKMGKILTSMRREDIYTDAR